MKLSSKLGKKILKILLEFFFKKKKSLAFLRLRLNWKNGKIIFLICQSIATNRWQKHYLLKLINGGK